MAASLGQVLKAHLSKKTYSEALTTLEDVSKLVELCYPTLEVEKIVDEHDKWVIICCAKYSRVESTNLGPIKPARMVFHHHDQYTFEVLMKTIKVGSWKTSQPPHKGITGMLDTLLSNSGYVLCPGIRDYKSLFEGSIKFQSKNLRIWSHPIPRHDSTDCLLWHKPSNIRIPSDSSLFNGCSSCKLLHQQLAVIKERALAASPDHKEKWTLPTSNRPFKYLSPASQAERLSKSTTDRKRLRKTILKFDDALDVQLNGEQDDELRQLVKAIEEKGKDELEAIFGSGAELKEAWERDVSSLKAFFEDQLKNQTSNRGNRWSTITFRVALAIYTRSPSAYDALRGFGILQLPSVSTLKAFTSFNLESAGFNEERLAHARRQYDEMVKEKKSKGEKVPFFDGILIFDEVKVGMKVHYHAKTGRFIGLAMTSDELGSLHDVYQTLQPDHRTQKTSYVLQYLWRCAASDYDIIGPYYTSSGGMSAKFLIATLFDAMYAFQLYGFRTKAVVCDGASSNLSALKTLSGFGSGAFGVKSAESTSDIHEVKAWFTNPYTTEKVFIIICPSHQNMVAALYSSHQNRTKLFSYEGVMFGWFPIEDMFEREVQRAKNGIPRRVPGLRESYIYRDIWTRLNVKPAKIMQQQYVLAELCEYIASNPADAPSIRMTIRFLQCLNGFFEEGILSHERITKIKSPVLERMEQGYKFFSTWLDSLLEQGLIPINPYQKSFLAWQTWDLLRLCWYGFSGYCEEFFERHPDHYVLPLRANGSAVETLFSQLKHSSGGTLTAKSYEPVRSRLITKRSIHGPHIRDEYRDAPLYVQDSELPLKKRPRKQ